MDLSYLLLIKHLVNNLGGAWVTVAAHYQSIMDLNNTCLEHTVELRYLFVTLACSRHFGMRMLACQVVTLLLRLTALRFTPRRTLQGAKQLVDGFELAHRASLPDVTA